MSSKMEPLDQAALVRDFMVALAPGISRYTLNALRVLKDFYPIRSEEAESDTRRRAANVAANITVEFASHMAARFAQLHDAANKGAQAKDAPASSKQDPKHTAAGV
jgi:hypothetical protein